MANTSTAKKVEITPTLQNCKITTPEPETDSSGASHYYLDAEHTQVTLTADDGCVFDKDGTFVYQGSYNEQTFDIKATNTNTVTFEIPTFDWFDQYTPFTLTMAATKQSTPTTPDTPTDTTPTTQLDVLKNSLRIPLDLKDDDALLQSYIDGATEYLSSTLDEYATGTRIDSKRAKVVINEIATLMYQNRGDDTVTKDFPFTLRALINQLKY